MDDNIGSVLAQVARLMRRNFDERARAIGVTRPQWQVLSLLARNEGINQGGLADILEVEPITLGRMIDRLQDADLVERRADPADRRAWRLHLTPKGTELILQLQPYARLTIDQALDGINDAESRRLMDTLLRMRSNLSRRPGLEEPRQP
jgi:DNA-binding MarR family transcriptional regulator